MAIEDRAYEELQKENAHLREALDRVMEEHKTCEHHKALLNAHYKTLSERFNRAEALIKEKNHELQGLKEKLANNGIPVNLTKDEMENVWRKLNQIIGFIEYLKQN